MHEFGALHDAVGKDVAGDQEVNAERTVPPVSRRVLAVLAGLADHRRSQRRHTVPQRALWVCLLLVSLLGMALLSACATPGAAGTLGAHAPTATVGLGGSVAAIATARAAADQSSAIFIAENGTSSGSVLALNPADGSVKWRSKPFAGTMGFGLLQQSQGVVLISVSGTLVALDAQDGTERWHTDGLYPTGGMVVDGNTFYINTSDTTQQTRVEAHRVTDGSLLWRYKGAACGPGNIAAAAGIVVLATEGCYPTMQVTALNERDGRVLWQRPAKGIGGEIAIASGGVYTDNFGIVTALDITTGATKWRYTPSQFNGMGGSSVSVSDQMVVAASSKTLLALRPQDGSLAWSVVFPAFLSGHVIVGKVVYITDNDVGTVTALRQSDGVRLWQKQLDLPNPWFPVAANGVLYVISTKPAVPPYGTETVKLYAIQMADGAVAWQHIAPTG